MKVSMAQCVSARRARAGVTRRGAWQRNTLSPSGPGQRRSTSRTSGSGRPPRDATTRWMAKSACSGPRRSFRPQLCIGRHLRHAAQAQSRHLVQEVTRPAVALVADHPARRQRAVGHQFGQQRQGQLRLGAEGHGFLGHTAAPPPFRMGCVPVPGLGQEQPPVDQRDPALPGIGHEHPHRMHPCLGMSVVSTGRIPLRVPGSAPTACQCRPGMASCTRGCPPQSTAGGAPGSCRCPAGAGPCARPACAAPRTAAPRHRRGRRSPGRGAGTGAGSVSGRPAVRA